MERLLNEASTCFTQALQLAKEKEHGIQELDALWGSAKVAYTRYRVRGDHELEEAAIAACLQMRGDAARLKLLAPESVIGKGNAAPAAGATEPTVLRLLSHVYELLARIHFLRFERRAHAVRAAKYLEIPYVERMLEAQRSAVQQAIMEDKEAANSLHEAIDYYMEAIGYSFLYSSRSRIVSDIYDDVYKRIKGLSGTMMAKIAQEVRTTYDVLHLSAIKRKGSDSPVDWMEQSFGYDGTELHE